MLSAIGPTSPNPPVSLGAKNVVHNATTVVWVVTEIAYTNESYVIRYGTDMNNLTNSSNPEEGGTDFLAVDQQFEIRIEGLESNTKYYFIVLAINSVGNTSSLQGTFTTVELREFNLTS